MPEGTNKQILEAAMMDQLGKPTEQELSLAEHHKNDKRQMLLGHINQLEEYRNDYNACREGRFEGGFEEGFSAGLQKAIDQLKGIYGLGGMDKTLKAKHGR